MTNDADAFRFLKSAGYDNDYYPYLLKGLDAYVYDNATGADYFAGRVDANYFSRSEAASECASLANSIAQANHIQDWSYICCTVTASSDCVTKVR